MCKEHKPYFAYNYLTKYLNRLLQQSVNSVINNVYYSQRFLKVGHSKETGKVICSAFRDVGY